MKKSISGCIVIILMVFIEIIALADDPAASDTWFPGEFGSSWTYRTFLGNVNCQKLPAIAGKGKEYRFIKTDAHWIPSLLDDPFIPFQGLNPFLVYRVESDKNGDRIYGYAREYMDFITERAKREPGIANVSVSMGRDEWLLVDSGAKPSFPFINPRCWKVFTLQYTFKDPKISLKTIEFDGIFLQEDRESDAVIVYFRREFENDKQLAIPNVVEGGYLWPPIWEFYLSEFGATKKSKLSISNKEQEVKGLWGEPLYELFFSKDGITEIINITGNMEAAVMIAHSKEVAGLVIEPIPIGKKNEVADPLRKIVISWGKIKAQ